MSYHQIASIFAIEKDAFKKPYMGRGSSAVIISSYIKLRKCAIRKIKMLLVFQEHPFYL